MNPWAALLVALPVLASAAPSPDACTGVEPAFPKGSRLHGADSLYVRGAWRPRVDAYAHIPRLNAADFHCDRASMTCVESMATVERTRSQASAPCSLFSLTFRYRVTEWTDRRLVAIRAQPGAMSDRRLFVDIASGEVRLDWWARAPASDADPATESYDMPLQDLF